MLYSLMYYISTCNTFYYIHFSYIFPVNIFVVFVRGKGILVYKHMHHLLSNILVYFDRNICWTTVIGGNQSSFRARNKSRTAIITIHDQPSILSFVEWGWLLCATSWKRHSFLHLWDCTSIYVWPINSMLTTFSVPTQYDIYFFMYGNSSSYCWSEDDCCVQPAEKSLSFICDMCIVHRTTIRSVHSGMQRTATSVPTQYYIYVSAALLCFDQASWWVV